MGHDSHGAAYSMGKRQKLITNPLETRDLLHGRPFWIARPIDAMLCDDMRCYAMRYNTIRYDTIRYDAMPCNDKHGRLMLDQNESLSSVIRRRALSESNCNSGRFDTGFIWQNVGK